MQTVPGYVADGDVYEPSVTVTHNGVVREVDSVSIDRELPSNLPAAVAGGSGVTAATGNVEWAEGQDVTGVAAHPWSPGPFPPQDYDTVTVDAGYGGGEARLLTGFIDGSSGSITDGNVSSGLVDGIDAFQKPITIDPLAASMPPLGELGAPYTYRHIGLSSLYFTDRCARVAGFYTTPPEANGCVFYAPFVGSAWPTVGTLYASGGVANQNPLFYSSPWSMGVRGVSANYFPWTSRATARLNGTIQLTAKVHTAFNVGHTPSRLTIAWGDDYIRLSVQNNRAVYAQAFAGGVFTDVAVMSASAAATATTFSVQVTPAGATTIYANNGATATGSFTPSAAMTGTGADRASVYVPEDGLVMGGFQIAMTTNPTWDHAPNAHMTVPAYFRQLEASPFIDNRMVIDVLKEQSEAECAAMWIDEQGTFRWVNRDILVGTSIRETITPLDDLEDVQWEHNTGSVRYRVDVKSRTVTPKPSPNYTKTAFQGSSTDLKLGDTEQGFATPEADTDWIMVDEDLKVVGSPGSSTLFNGGYGSFVGATSATRDSNNVDYEYVADQGITSSLERINSQTYKYSVTVVSLPSGFNLELRTPGDGFTTAFWPSKRNFDLPILRCKEVLHWGDLVTSGFHLGPIGAPVLEHDVGWWIQDTEELERLADWLSFQLATPAPMIRNLSVIPDDRRQLADIVQIEFGTVVLKALIVGISNSISGTDKQQSLTVRILTATTGTTYEVFDAAYAGDTYTELDTAWGADTYNTLDSDPLREA